MKDRLIELLLQSDPIKERDLDDEWYDGEIENIADHLLANGVMVPPVKVGDVVYAKYSGTNETEYYVVDNITHFGSKDYVFEAHLENEDGYTVDTIAFFQYELGKTVFLTKEEADKALEKKGGNADEVD